MKPDQRNYGKVNSTLGGDKIAMAIDPEAMAHIMNIMTDLYSDPVKAIIREYTTNGLDAHREIGNTDPVVVELPTQLSPFLKIRDNGVGLSPEDIHAIYSKYGASTKRDTNDQVGMLGLGCKSALTYADQFTLIGVKDGTRCQVSVSRDEDGAGSMTVVDTSDTDEASGVEVIIPVKQHDIQTFESKAGDFFRFWDEGTVLVNGKPPTRISGFRVNDNLIVTEDRQDYIVMGNVPYPVDLQDGMNSYNHSLVAFVEIGEVSFAPSREALFMNDKTKATIASIEKAFKAGVQDAIQREVDSCESGHEAVRLIAKWQNVLPGAARHQSYKFGTRAIPEDYKAANIVLVNGYRGGTLSRHQTVTVVAMEAWANSVWVHGYDAPNFTAGQKKKLNKWAEDNGQEPKHYILTEGKPDPEWVAPEQLIDWETIKAIKLPRSGGVIGSVGGGRLAGSYDLYKAGSRQSEVAAADIDTSYPLFHFTHGGVYESGYVTLLTEAHPDCTIVCLQANRVNKFERDFPSSKTVSEGALEAFESWKAGISKEQAIALHIEDDGGRYTGGAQEELKVLDTRKVTDPALRKAIKLAKMDLTKLIQERIVYREVFGYGAGPEVEGWTNPLDSYPLYDNANMPDDSKHVYLYLNAAYAAQQKEG